MDSENQVENLAPETAVPEAVTPPPVDTPPSPPAEQGEDISGLKNAYSRTKEENARLKEQAAKQKEILQALQEKLGTDGEAARLLDRFTIEQQIEAKIAQERQSVEARLRNETEQTIRQYKQQVSESHKTVEQFRHRQAVLDFYNANGGRPEGFADFYALAGKQFQIEQTGEYTAKVAGVQGVDGRPISQEDGSAYTPEIYAQHLRQRKLGSPALQACFVEWNQSAGVGTTAGGRSLDGQVVLSNTQENQDAVIQQALKAGKNPSEALRAIKWV